MKPRIALLALAIVGSLAITSCKRTPTPPSPAPGAPAAAPAGETADQFVARVNEEFRAISAELNAAQWLSNTYINGDSEMLAAKANERWLTQLNAWIAQAKRFEGQQLSPDTARAIKLIKLMTAMPAPKDPKLLQELTRLATPHGRHLWRGQVLHRHRRGDHLPRHRPTQRGAREKPRLRRPAGRLAGLAHHQPADAQGLHPLCRTGEHRRQGNGLRRCRRDVALGLRHEPGRTRRRERSPVGPGQAPVRTAALLCARQAGCDLRQGQGRGGRRHVAPRT